MIVPDGVLFGSSKAHKELRRITGRGPQARRRREAAERRFRPYAGVSTAILLFTKTSIGGTDHVWFYEVRPTAGRSTTSAPAAGRRQTRPCARRRSQLTTSTPRTTCPTCSPAGGTATAQSGTRARTEQSFCVPKADIAAQGYDLSLNRYKEVVHDEVEHRPPLDIIADLERLEGRDPARSGELKAML